MDIKRLVSGILKITAFIFAAALSTSWTSAATSPGGMWSDIDRTKIASKGMRATVPDRYRAVQLDIKAMDAALAKAPMERSPGIGASIMLPMPDNSFHEFLVKNSPVMAPELAKKLPGVSTFIAVSKKDPAINGRLDITPAGFHAIIFTHHGTVYIDPYQMGSNTEYMSYYKRMYNKNREPLLCSVTGKSVSPDQSPVDQSFSGGGSSIGDTLRTYRIAVAATGEYTTFHGGTVAGGLAAITTTINRVTGIYERELSVRLELIANNDSIVYTDPIGDPYSNFNAGALLTENQDNLDLVILPANYDIGHVFGTGGGGLASPAVVCNNAAKARGETGSGSPVGDPFDVDFVAHEIGHQFGGNHTFNGVAGNCSGGNRNASTAYEPGSGSTIQAYAGICGSDNLQSNSDDYFHNISFDQMNAHVTNSATCSNNTPTGNSPPSVDAGAFNQVYPANTPILLRSGSFSDPDAGQTLTFNWEQLDLGPAAALGAGAGGTGPLFRSFPAQITDVRFLPRMPDLLAGISNPAELLPTASRSLTFRLTVRDNAAGGGGVATDVMSRSVVDTAGPFVVTSQTVPTDWPVGSLQTVTWDVANTDVAPISCSTVSVYYSTIDFQGFSGTPLANFVPNDGSEQITVPNQLGPNGRVMVVCLTAGTAGEFFNINAADITIVPSLSDCGDSILDAGEQCDDGNAAAGDGCSDTCQIETGYSCTAPIPGSPGSNALPEGGFESGTPSPVWAEASTNFGTPLCDITCGIDAAFEGNWYAWFGGINGVSETGSVSQSFVIETGDTELTFARRLALCDSAFDFLAVRIDSNVVYDRYGDDPDCGEADYQIETINLATANGGPYNDGLSHDILIDAKSFAENGGRADFFVDDVQILRGATDPQPSVCTLLGPPNDDFDNAIAVVAGTTVGTLVDATDDGSTSLDTFASPDIWYLYTAPADGLLRANTCGTAGLPGATTNSILSLHPTGGAGTAANEIIANNDSTVGNDPTACGGDSLDFIDAAVAWPMLAGETFLIQVSEWDAFEADILLNISLDTTDSDGDGVVDAFDNCTLLTNPGQEDSNGDGIGNICDQDVNNNCNVDFVDYGFMVNTGVIFSMPGDAGWNPDFDFDSNGVYNFLDVGKFGIAGTLFNPPGPSANECIPDAGA